jgi:hypothetical protein
MKGAINLLSPVIGMHFLLALLYMEEGGKAKELVYRSYYTEGL